MRSRNGVLGLLAALALGSGSVQAADLMSFSFSDLLSQFDGTSTLMINDDDNSDGELTRLIPVVGDAFFGPNSAAFNIGMTVSSITDTTATGAGTITFTDADGDIFSGDLTGEWLNITGSANFVGQIMNFGPDSSGGDGIFEGTTGGSFDMDFGSAPPFAGNIITLVFGNWFTDGAGTTLAFDSPTTEAIGAIVPEPATLALLAIGGLIASRRRS